MRLKTDTIYYNTPFISFHNNMPMYNGNLSKNASVK